MFNIDLISARRFVDGLSHPLYVIALYQMFNGVRGGEVDESGLPRMIRFPLLADAGEELNFTNYKEAVKGLISSNILEKVRRFVKKMVEGERGSG